jgi:hypothetical protein
VTPAGLPSPVLTLLLVTPLVRCAVAVRMHPEYRRHLAERRAARLNSRKDVA